MNLFLTSYLAATINLAGEFLADLEPKNITFIPTAANVEEYKDYVDEAKVAFEKLGFSINLLDIATTPREKIVQILDKTKCLYVSGGNTFYLLQELKRKDLLDTIKMRIKNGMFYIGESSGAIITASDISYIKPMDDVSLAPELTDYAALGVFDKFIVPHNGEFPFEQSTAEILKTYEKTIELLPINNQQAVIVKDGKVWVK